MRLARPALAGVAGVLLAATASLAQPSPNYPSRDGRGANAAPRASRFSFGVDGVAVDPRGSFGRNIPGTGFGIGGHALVRVDPLGILALRVDVANAQYGSEREPLASSPYYGGYGGRVALDVRTRNSLAWFGIGPELTVPLGPVRPYVNASIAYARFSTVSDLEGEGYDAYGNYQSRSRLASSQNQDDGTSARSAGAGVYIPVGPPRWLANAHLGVRYYDGAEAEYLREGSITDNADGSISFTPLRSRTPFVAYQVGLSVAIPGSRRR
jgi:hypothetical protein